MRYHFHLIFSHIPKLHVHLCAQLPSGAYNFILDSATNEIVPVTLYGYQFNSSCAKSTFFLVYPTASPYVVSVGATQINPYAASSCQEVETEIYCETSTGSLISGGGGFSFVSPQPFWQTNLVNLYLNGRHFTVVQKRGVVFFDGTSASSPSLAGMFALMNEVLLSNRKKPLGLITHAQEIIAVNMD
jgi:tripeptidyl-peptidase-1